MNKDSFYVGMDLGAFKTSVASSNGKRSTMHTAVGWPKDHVARAMLGKSVVFGEETFEHRLALDVVRPFAKGALKYVSQVDAGVSDADLVRHKAAAQLLVHRAVANIEPPEGCPVYGVVGAPSRASVKSS